MKTAHHSALVFGLIVTFVLSFGVFLRTFRLSQSPPSPYWEEVALGYDAYSLLKTGKDHHGVSWPILAAESFGDWKPTGYLYALLPSLALLGLETAAVRLPAVVSGIVIFCSAGYIAWKITGKRISGLLGLAVAAVSPWGIQFSRAGWEVTLATGLFLVATIVQTDVLSAKPTKKNKWILVGSGVLLWLSAYTYHAFRLLVPIWLFLIGLVMVAKFFGKKRKLTLLQRLVNATKSSFTVLWPLVLVSLLAILPFAQALGSSQLNQRFAETSIFSDSAIVEQSNYWRQASGNTLLSRLVSHRFILFGKEMAQSYFSHFDPVFLFFRGDENLRHSSGYGGQLYVIDAFTIIAGVQFLFTHKSKLSKPWVLLLFGLLFLSPIPASLTKATPHALRTLPLSVGFNVLSALGLTHLIYYCYEYGRVSFLEKKLSFKSVFITMIPVLIVGVIYALQATAWASHYFYVYPVLSAHEWQFGYQEMVNTVATLHQKDPNLPVYITREYGRPAMYYWFYTQTSPNLVQEANATAKKDQGEFLTFENFVFIRGLYEIKQRPSIVALSPSDWEKLQLNVKDGSEPVIIKDLESKPIWIVASIE